jgi:hypothetical protein
MRTTTARALGALAAAALLTPPVLAIGPAQAEGVFNYVTANGNGVGQNANVLAGTALQINYLIKGDSGCAAANGTPALVSIDVPSGVSMSPAAPLTFTQCGVAQSVSFIASTPGTYAIPSAVVTDSGDPGAYTGEQKTYFNLKVLPTSGGGGVDAVCTDLPAAPTIGTVAGTGEPGNSPWFKAAPEIAAASGVMFAVPGGAFDPTPPVLGEGVTTVSAVASNDCGTSAVASRTFSVDSIPPTVGPADVVDATWRRTGLPQIFDASDGGSGLADLADASFTLTASDESPNRTTLSVVSRAVTDVAGNTTTRSVSAMIDKTPPTDIAITGPDHVARGSVPTAACSATDALSDVSSCVVTGYVTSTLTGGTPRTLTATATDNAGNSSQSTKSYVVDSYAGVVTDCGIRQPILCGTQTLFSRGKTIPVKFGLDNDGLSSAFPAGFPNAATWDITAVSSKCDQPKAAFAAGPNASVAFKGARYDVAADQYVYNAAMSKQPVGSCWQFVVVLDSGQTLRSSVFKLQS